MKQWLGMPVVGALLLSACVTINVYFPAAEAKAAAREFVEKVIDEADSTQIKDSSGGGMAMQLRRFDFDASRFERLRLRSVDVARYWFRASAKRTRHQHQDPGDPGNPVAHGGTLQQHPARGLRFRCTWVHRRWPDRRARCQASWN